MEKERAICFEFKKMHHVIVRAVHERLAAAGFDEVTVMHGHILGYLYCNRERDIYPRDVAKAFEIGRPSVTNILQLMEEKGYLILRPDERDGRLKKIHLTGRGEEIHRQTMEIIDKLHEDLEEGITEEERLVFFRVEEKIRKNMVKNETIEKL